MPVKKPEYLIIYRYTDLLDDVVHLITSLKNLDLNMHHNPTKFMT